MDEKTAREIGAHPENYCDIGPLGHSQTWEAKGYLAGLEAERARCAEIAIAVGDAKSTAYDDYERGWEDAAETIADKINAAYTTPQNDGQRDK
jgi:hypothetical protein